MVDDEKSIDSINLRIKKGNAVVLTEMELMEEIRCGYRVEVRDIDAITIGCYADMSGTAAMISVPVTGRGVFTRADKIWLNGVRGYPGPAPNERLGLVESLVFASEQADNERSFYNGAMLYRDLLKRKEIHAECLSLEGNTYETTFSLDEIEFARMYVYNFFFERLWPKDEVSLNMNHLKTIRGGSKILVNKAIGVVVGCGTRSTPGNRALSIAADMFGMDADDMKEFETDTRLNTLNSIALAIPVTSEEVIKDISDCLVYESEQKCEGIMNLSENSMADYLAQLIKKGEFLFVSSDIYLTNWFLGG